MDEADPPSPHRDPAPHISLSTSPHNSTAHVYPVNEGTARSNWVTMAKEVFEKDFPEGPTKENWHHFEDEVDSFVYSLSTDAGAEGADRLWGILKQTYGGATIFVERSSIIHQFRDDLNKHYHALVDVRRRLNMVYKRKYREMGDTSRASIPEISDLHLRNVFVNSLPLDLYNRATTATIKSRNMAHKVFMELREVITSINTRDLGPSSSAFTVAAGRSSTLHPTSRSSSLPPMLSTYSHPRSSSHRPQTTGSGAACPFGQRRSTAVQQPSIGRPSASQLPGAERYSQGLFRTFDDGWKFIIEHERCFKCLQLTSLPHCARQCTSGDIEGNHVRFFKEHSLEVRLGEMRALVARVEDRKEYNDKWNDANSPWHSRNQYTHFVHPGYFTDKHRQEFPDAFASAYEDYGKGDAGLNACLVQVFPVVSPHVAAASVATSTSAATPPPPPHIVPSLPVDSRTNTRAVIMHANTTSVFPPPAHG
ncbi:hypothetical protein JCM1840_002888 [Sporobolomyces johnsonii]